MASLTLEQRCAALEKRLAAIEIELRARGPLRSWRNSIGMFSGDEVMKEICQAALKYREVDRRRARSS